MFYLPQTPYLFYGTLLEQVIYPSLPLQPGNNVVSAQEAREQRERALSALALVGLSSLLRGKYSSIHNVKYGGEAEDTESMCVNWPSILSPGEQQLICFARLFFHKPTFAILDESTSSLSEDVEYKLYQTCQESGITLISIGHRSTLRKYHNMLLLSTFDKKWKLSSIRQEGGEHI